MKEDLFTLTVRIGTPGFGDTAKVEGVYNTLEEARKGMHDSIALYKTNIAITEVRFSSATLTIETPGKKKPIVREYTIQRFISDGDKFTEAKVLK